ncbi:hypothetical protein [Flexivirga lutea]
MLKPASIWERVIWVALPIIVVGAIVAIIVQGNGAAAWVLLIAAAFAIVNLIEMRRRARKSRTQSNA